MEASRKTANSSRRGRKNIQPDLGDTHEPYILTEDKGRRIGGEWETHHGKLAAEEEWAHQSSPLALLWLFISLPLVIWDTFYVLLRPRSMIGGDLHSPIFVPYKLYSRVDLIYGFPAIVENDGFTGAQAWLNVVETLGYLIYMAIVWKAGTSHGPSRLKRKIKGIWGASAALLGFAMSVMTVSKTILYIVNQFCNGFKHIGHNTAFDVSLMWILPNFLWTVLPAYMALAFSREILQGLAIASQGLTGQLESPLDSFKEE